MSRSGYSDSLDNWELIKWRGAVSQAIKGKRGQALLTDLLVALDALPEKRLVANALERDGEYCTLGVLGKHRGLDLGIIDADEREDVAQAFHVAPALVAEIAFENDEGTYERETAEARWIRMRAWVAEQIQP